MLDTFQASFLSLLFFCVFFKNFYFIYCVLCVDDFLLIKKKKGGGRWWKAFLMLILAPLLEQRGVDKWVLGQVNSPYLMIISANFQPNPFSH